MLTFFSSMFCWLFLRNTSAALAHRWPRGCARLDVRLANNQLFTVFATFIYVKVSFPAKSKRSLHWSWTCLLSEVLPETVSHATENKFHVTEGCTAAQAVCTINGSSRSEGSFLFLCQSSTPEQEKSFQEMWGTALNCRIVSVLFPWRGCKIERNSTAHWTLARALHHRLERSGWQGASESEIWSGIFKVLNFTPSWLRI